MRRALSVLVIVLTVVVVAAAGYVITHSDPVPGAGSTPTGLGTFGASPVASTTRSPSSTGTGSSDSPSGSASTGSSGSSSTGVTLRRVAFIGDNYTAGAGASAPGKSWAAVLSSQLGLVGKRFSVPGGGYAKPGSDGRTYQALVSSAVASDPDLVIVSGGRNDTVDDVQTLRDQARQLFASLRSKLPDATIVAVAPWWGDSPHPDTLTAVDDAVRAGVTAANGTYLAMLDPLANHPGWMADAANPDDTGHLQIASAVAAALKQQSLLG